ncbi:MAG: hypothetical protein K6E95_04715 [Lachnospiraceae bacterium]|nr:hypothetical protein [Lachnospiraceae bacterium]
MRKEFRIPVIICMVALAFIVLDLPVRFSKFVNDMPPYLGIKNAVSPATSLMVGPLGMIGSVIGALVCGLVDKAASMTDVTFEVITVAFEGLAIWFFWHLFTPNHKVRFKKFTDLLRYAVIVAVISAVSGAVSFIFVDGGAFLSVFLTHMITSILIGVPSIIIFSGIMCQSPVIPPWYTRLHDLEDDIEATDDSFLGFNDKVEEFTSRLGLSKKRTFEILNTIEEVYLRIRTHEPEEKVHVTIDCEEALSIMFEYKGEKCNPLRISAEEDLVALIGLKLIEHRAIRTNYKYSAQTNHVLIVL